MHSQMKMAFAVVLTLVATGATALGASGKSARVGETQVEPAERAPASKISPAWSQGNDYFSASPGESHHWSLINPGHKEKPIDPRYGFITRGSSGAMTPGWNRSEIFKEPVWRP